MQQAHHLQQFAKRSERRNEMKPSTPINVAYCIEKGWMKPGPPYQFSRKKSLNKKEIFWLQQGLTVRGTVRKRKVRNCANENVRLTDRC
jgi:hypothetical protein